MTFCEDSSDCPRPDTICLDIGVCWFNLCGTDKTDAQGNFLNGAPFEACDTRTGEITAGVEPTGTCVPDDSGEGNAVFICHASGPAQVDEVCRWDALRGDSGLCAQGGVCLGTQLPTPVCTTDDECDSSQVCQNGRCTHRPCTEDSQCGEDRYCHADEEICLPFQACFESCNAGNGEFDGDFATCRSTSDGCRPLNDANWEKTASAGYCDGPVCSLIEGGCEEDGDACQFVGFLGGQPLGGLCGDGTNHTIPVGSACTSQGPARCEEGSICLAVGEGPVGPSNPLACRAFCGCEDGFDQESGRCLGFASECDVVEACFAAWPTGPLGTCAPYTPGEEPGTGGTGGGEGGNSGGEGGAGGGEGGTGGGEGGAGGDDVGGGVGGAVGTGGIGGAGGIGDEAAGSGGAGGSEDGVVTTPVEPPAT
ncbi:MAG TPA: hypothetical protein VGD74_04645 [Vulgatibacter sp.]